MVTCGRTKKIRPDFRLENDDERGPDEAKRATDGETPIEGKVDDCVGKGYALAGQLVDRGVSNPQTFPQAGKILAVAQALDDPIRQQEHRRNCGQNAIEEIHRWFPPLSSLPKSDR